MMLMDYYFLAHHIQWITFEPVEQRKNYNGNDTVNNNIYNYDDTTITTSY